MKKSFARKVLVLCLLVLAGMFLTPGDTEAAAPKISSSQVKLTVGNTKTLKMKNTKKKVLWASNKKSVAKVSSKGVVTARKKGTATITAKVSGKKYKCKVTVTDAKLNASKCSISMDATMQLKFKTYSGKGVTWKSSNAKVATVTKNGLVKGIKPGTAVISAKLQSSTYKCNVTITPADAKATMLDFGVSGGGDFICGTNMADVSFSLNASTVNVKAQILDATDTVVYTNNFADCKKGTAYQFQWDGKNTAGQYVGDNSCRVRITAGKQETLSPYLTVKGKNDFAAGNGAEKNPYQVETLEQLQKVREYSNRFFIQMADIDAQYETFYPMFSDDNPFMGTYDGNNKTISNLIIKNATGAYEASMFRNIGEKGIVQNLNLSKCSSSVSLDKDETIYSACLAVKNSGKIQNCVLDSCTVSNTTQNTQSSKNIYSGMIVEEQTETGTVTSCTVKDCTINAAALTRYGQAYAGGIVSENQGKVINCTVENMIGEVSSQYNGSSGIGGIAANNKSGGVIINGKVVNGNLTATKYAGGIVGQNLGQIQGWSFSGETTGATTGEGAASDKGTTIK